MPVATLQLIKQSVFFINFVIGFANRMCTKRESRKSEMYLPYTSEVLAKEYWMIRSGHKELPERGL